MTPEHQPAQVAPTFFENPFSAFAELRQRAPVQKINMRGRESWLVTRYEDVLTVLKDQRFVLNPAGQPPPPANAPLFRTFPHLLSADGLDHRRLRALVSKGFTPSFIEALRPQVQQLAHELIDVIEASPTSTFDFIEAFAFPLPFSVICDMLGLPVSDREQLHVWSKALTDDVYSPVSKHQEKMSAFVAYLKRLFEHKRRRPEDDLISKLVHIEESGDALSEDELIGFVALLFFAGHETVTNLLGNSVVALLTQPKELAKLRAQPELMPLAVEELLRLEGPVTLPAPRYPTEDLTVGDQLIRAGEAVMVALSSANRDEARFSDPADLELTRELNKHLAFGQGVHHCLGAPLARLEVQEALTILLERFPKLTLAGDLSWQTSPALRGLSALPLSYG